MHAPGRDLQPVLRKPHSTDGAALHALIAACPPLDPNSLYCNLLQCSHFADSAVVAEREGELLGAISGYRLPQAPDTLFVWQVAVSPAARGLGLGKRMLLELVQRDAADDPVRALHTTITANNDASWRLFRSFARALGSELSNEVLFASETHFKGQHASEHLVRIGPLPLARHDNKQQDHNKRIPA